MSTRSSISALQKDNTVKSIYCHWDGDLSGVGETLLTYYNSYEKANELLALGNLSSLYENLNPLPEAPEAFPKSDITEILTTHSYDKPQRGVTVAYHRDRKEKFEQEVHCSLRKFNKDNDFQMYNYLFKEGHWYVMSEYIKDREWVTLTDEMIKSEE
jgi:hypothetical protein